MLASIILLVGLLQANEVSSFMLSPTQQCILKDMSWKLKVKVFNNLLSSKVYRRNEGQPFIHALVYPNTNRNQPKPNEESNQRSVDIQSLTLRKKNVKLAKELKRNVAVDFLVKGPAYPTNSLKNDDESSMSIEEISDSKKPFKPVSVNDGLQTNYTNKNKFLYRRQANPETVSLPAEGAETERDMKLKLFRLMYDTVKDNDDLVRKAEAIKKKYDNTDYFEIGFIMAAVTDKVNTMSAVALTLERLYDEWKPIEHVNAYEQIANQAVEINHLIDILVSTHRKIAAKEKPPTMNTTPKSLQETKSSNQVIRRRDLDRTL